MLENLPRGRRCSVHGMALAPDGLCILCRRDRGTARRGPTGLATYTALGAGLLAAGGVATALIIGQPPQDTRRVASRTAPQPTPAATPTTREAMAPPSATAGSAEPATTRASAAAPAPRSLRETPIESAAPTKPRPRRPRRKTKAATLDPAAEAREREALAARQRMDAAFERQAIEQAIGRVRINVYLTSWCPACRKARQWLHANHIAARQIDIERDLRGHQALLRLNPQGTIPTFEIEGQVLVGFSAGRIQQAIIRAARRHMTAL